MCKIYPKVILLICFVPLLLFAENSIPARIDPSLSDSTIIIMDSLITKEAGMKYWKDLTILGISLIAIPPGIANGIELILIPKSIINFEPLGKAAITIPVSYMLAYPICVGYSILDIINKEAKQRLLIKYEGYKIIDNSSIKSKYIPSYSVYLGTNYATFLTNNVFSRLNLSGGIRYDRRISRHLSLATSMQISRRNLTINDKICQYNNPGEHSTTYQKITVNYNTLEVYCPVYLKLSCEIKPGYNLYCSTGAGFPFAFQLHDNIVQYENTSETDYDYIRYDEPSIPYSNPMYSVNIGLSGQKYFYEFELTQDFNYPDRSRNFNRLAFTEKFLTYQFIIGYTLPIR